MNIDIIQISKLHMMSQTESGFNIPIDAAKLVGGEEKGARPMELFLASLAACSGIDVLLMLEKAKASVSHFNIHIEAKRREEVPKIFTSIKLTYQIKASGVNEQQLSRIIRLAVEKYCSVRAMIKAEVKINYKLELKKS